MSEELKNMEAEHNHGHCCHDEPCGGHDHRTEHHHGETYDSHDHGTGHHHDESCSCHDHGAEHHHDESCSCHDHEAEHHHDESCSCHDHETEHRHDDSCGCHEHGHEHEHHHHESEEFPSVSVYTHDIAVIGSVKCRIDGRYEDALDELQACMREAAKAVEEAGGLIGHIKAFAKEEARSCMISITEGEDIQRKPAEGSGIYVENANIVFGVTTEQLEQILRKAFSVFLN